MPEQLFDIRRRAVLSRSAMSRSVFSDDDDDDDARADASGDRARWLATTSIGAARAEASWASLTRLDLRANGLTTLKGRRELRAIARDRRVGESVSYTHLTLPTIRML